MGKFERHAESGLRMNTADTRAHLYDDLPAKLPEHRFFEEDGEERVEFCFSNGIKLVTTLPEEPPPGETGKFLRMRKLLVPFNGGDVDLMQLPIAEFCEHYVAFRVSLDSSHYQAESRTKSEENGSETIVPAHTVVYVSSANGKFDEAKFPFTWLHEAGHAVDLSTHPLSPGLDGAGGSPQDERRAHAIALKTMRRLKEQYGESVVLSAENFAKHAERALHTRQGGNDFSLAYSSEDRKFFRPEYLATKKITNPQEARALINTKRQESVVDLMRESGIPDAEREYKIFAARWIEDTARRREIMAKLIGEEIDPKEVASQVEQEWHADTLMKRNKAWSDLCQAFPGLK